MPFVIIPDACVLFPASIRDTILTAAELGLYRIHLTDDILEEVRRNLAQKRMSEANAQKLVDTIRETFAEYTITRHKALIERMPVNEGDRHVLAAAVVSNADFIVTQNLRHFPKSILSQFGVQAISPDQFLMDRFHSAPERMEGVLIKQARNLRNPPMTIKDLLDVLENHVPIFVGNMRNEF